MWVGRISIVNKSEARFQVYPALQTQQGIQTIMTYEMMLADEQKRREEMYAVMAEEMDDDNWYEPIDLGLDSWNGLSPDDEF